MSNLDKQIRDELDTASRRGRGPRLESALITLATASDFVRRHHRHHPPPQGHKVSIGARIHGTTDLAGVVVVGRPIARHYDDGATLEVVRSCTDGTRNANSYLYAAAWRAAKALGADRLITYTQHGESGASQRAAGWRAVYVRPAAGGWSRPGRPRRDAHPVRVERTMWLAGTPWPDRHDIGGRCHEMQPTCVACGYSLAQPDGPGRRRTTCSDACRQRAHRRRARRHIGPSEEFVAHGGLWEAAVAAVSPSTTEGP